MDTLRTESTPEEHKLVITDVRFRPNSSQLATASFDQSVRLWDAANVIALFLFCQKLECDFNVYS
jgi:WD40 repeat protein